MSESKLLTSDRPLIVLPALAKEIKTNAAVVLQQIHYWSQNPNCGKVIDGEKWIYNTFEAWQEQLSHLSVSTIKRAIALLRKLKLIVVEQHNRNQWDHTNYYRIDYQALETLQLSIGSTCDHRSGQTELIDSANLNQSSTTPKTTSKTTTEHGLPVVAEEKKAEILREAVPAAKISKKEQPTEEELNAASRQISALTTSVKVTLQVRGAIAQYWANFPAALERLKIAVEENWNCKNLTGVLVKALKEGVPSEDAAPPCTFYGWGEWANEATKRRLMEYSESQNGDIRVHFVGGASRLWSEVRSLTWLELEKQLHQQIT